MDDSHSICESASNLSAGTWKDTITEDKEVEEVEEVEEVAAITIQKYIRRCIAREWSSLWQMWIQRTSVASEITATIPEDVPPIKQAPIKQAPVHQGMDQLNKDSQAFVKHVFTDHDSGRALSYSEMRMRYG